MSLLEDIRTKLLADGVAHATNYPCFIGYHPDDPDASMAITYSGGLPQDTLGRENLLGSFQVKLRAAEYAHDVVEAKFRAAFNSLQDAEGSITGVQLMQAINSEPLTFYDQKNRVCMSLNMRFQRIKP